MARTRKTLTPKKPKAPATPKKPKDTKPKASVDEREITAKETTKSIIKGPSGNKTPKDKDKARSLPRNRAYLLTQLRTGHNWLSTYAKKFGFRDDDQCECRARETVSHVLLECPNLRDLRVELRRNAGDAFHSVSSLLGGSNEGEKGKPDIVSRAKTVQAVLDFAEASQRFRSRAP